MRTEATRDEMGMVSGRSIERSPRPSLDVCRSKACTRLAPSLERRSSIKAMTPSHDSSQCQNSAARRGSCLLTRTDSTTRKSMSEEWANSMARGTRWMREKSGRASWQRSSSTAAHTTSSCGWASRRASMVRSVMRTLPDCRTSRARWKMKGATWKPRRLLSPRASSADVSTELEWWLGGAPSASTSAPPTTFSPPPSPPPPPPLSPPRLVPRSPPPPSFAVDVFRASGATRPLLSSKRRAGAPPLTSEAPSSVGA
mmetsp:Transcript_41252/g.113469  ORF Transcript_41252/g.113469 Transcript_41252/m.113469 type:complete len:256 (-) Transcript_41252:1810-2577(-)